MAAIRATGVAFIWHAAVLNGTTYRTHPAAGNHTNDIRATNDSDETVAAQDRDPLEPIACENLGDFIYHRLLSDTDDALRHDVGDAGALLADNIGLGNDTYHATLMIKDGHATDVVVCEDPGGVLHGGIEGD